MSDIDIPALAHRIRDHRFAGYPNNMLADEIDKFRSGQGISALSAAVGALKAVAEALAETDRTLRTELGKLGVEWRGDAGTRAWWAMSDEADFSAAAGATVEDSAARVFAQGEAFNRTLHKLPEARALRASLDGAGVTDFAFTLLGFETDHTRRIEAAREARQQAVQTLDAYAQDSGDTLVGVPRMPVPSTMKAVISSTVPESIDAGGGPGDVTAAAAASGPAPSGSAPGSATVPPATGGGSGGSEGSGGSGAPAPAPRVGAGRVPARSTGGVPAPSGGTPSSAASTTPSAASTTPSSGTGPSAAVSGGAVGTVDAARQADQSAQPHQNQQQLQPEQWSRPVQQGQQSRQLQAGAAPGVVVGGGIGPGERAPGVSGGSAGSAPPATGSAPGGPAAPAPREQQLGSGASSAAVQPQQGSVGGSGGAAAGSPTTRGGVSANDLGGGVAALGAGGVAGALSGGEERTGRGVGRSAPGAARSPHRLPIGDLPEEEVRVQRGSDRLNPGGDERRRALLERAAPGADADDGHVRRFGVDDNDLFTDQRTVAPDVIGDGTEGNL